MSAKRDKGHKIKLIHSNLYQIYTADKNKASMAKSVVIKAEDLNKPSGNSIRVNAYVAQQMAGKKIARPATAPEVAVPITLELMKQNVKSLGELQVRLRFILKELEDLMRLQGTN